MLQAPVIQPLVVIDLDELESCVSLAKAGVLLPELPPTGWPTCHTERGPSRSTCRPSMAGSGWSGLLTSRPVCARRWTRSCPCRTSGKTATTRIKPATSSSAPAHDAASACSPGPWSMRGIPQVHRRSVATRIRERLTRLRTAISLSTCGATPPLPQRGCAGLPSQRQRRVPGQRLNGSRDAMGMVPIRQPALAAGTNKASPPPGASRTARNGTGRPGCPAHRQTSSFGARIMGQNGRRSAKRAVIRTARSARTLYTICTQPLLRIDPQ